MAHNTLFLRGQGLIELILAMAIFALVVPSLTSLALGSFQGLTQGGEQVQAESIASEGIEAVRAIKNRAWNEGTFSSSGVEIASGTWAFSGESTTDTIGAYTRTLTFGDVCRDTADEIVDCPGDYTDVHSKQVSVVVEWEVRPGVTNQVQKIAYLTNWRSQYWIEDIDSDFGDGTFDNTETTTILGDFDGAVVLTPN